MILWIFSILQTWQTETILGKCWGSAQQTCHSQPFFLLLLSCKDVLICLNYAPSSYSLQNLWEQDISRNQIESKRESREVLQCGLNSRTSNRLRNRLRGQQIFLLLFFWKNPEMDQMVELTFIRSPYKSGVSFVVSRLRRTTSIRVEVCTDDQNKNWWRNSSSSISYFEADFCDLFSKLILLVPSNITEIHRLSSYKSDCERLLITYQIFL